MRIDLLILKKYDGSLQQYFFLNITSVYKGVAINLFLTKKDHCSSIYNQTLNSIQKGNCTMFLFSAIFSCRSSGTKFSIHRFLAHNVVLTYGAQLRVI